MGPKRMLLTVMLAGILTSSVIHLGQRWLEANGRVAPDAATAADPRRYAGGPDVSAH